MDDADRRYDATPARKRRAIAEGNVARSAELTSIVAFGAALAAACCALPSMSAAAAAAVRAAARAPFDAAPAAAALVALALVPAATAACGGGAAALGQAGGLRVNPPRADLARLNPLAGLKRMAGGEAAVAALRAAAALIAAVALMAPLAGEIVASAGNLTGAAPVASLVLAAGMRACIAACAIGALFAAADYAIARRRWLRGLRMSFDEVKRDAKEHDGDPLARARRKSVHRGMARSALSRVREASFVVVNPTHVAVALRYCPPDVPVPEILVRALDEAALRVRTVAREHGIPVVENAALARSLYARGESGRAIPPDAYVAVAHVVAALVREGVLA